MCGSLSEAGGSELGCGPWSDSLHQARCLEASPCPSVAQEALGEAGWLQRAWTGAAVNLLFPVVLCDPGTPTGRRRDSEEDSGYLGPA